MKPQHDVFLYRMGYFNYQKLNMQNMVQRYEGDKWYNVDIIIDWTQDQQTVTIFIDGVQKMQDNFFNNETIGSSSIV